MIKTDIQIRFGDIDALHHVNNGAIIQYYDLGVADYVRSILNHKNSHDGAGMAKVHIEMNFMDSIEMYDTVYVETEVIRIGEKSLTFRQRIIEKNSGKLKSDCVTVLAGFNVKERTSKPIPTEWKAIIEAHESETK